MITEELLATMQTNENENLLNLSKVQPVLLVFLRHFGCIFCREAMVDLSGLKSSFESRGIKVVLVHMSDYETAAKYFEMFGLQGVTNISDPECKFYRDFGLGKGRFSQLFGLKSWARGIEVTLVKGIPFTFQQIGDGFQMPGVFYIRNGKVLNSFIHKTSADRPDYQNIISVA